MKQVCSAGWRWFVSMGRSASWSVGPLKHGPLKCRPLEVSVGCYTTIWLFVSLRMYVERQRDLHISLSVSTYEYIWNTGQIFSKILIQIPFFPQMNAGRIWGSRTGQIFSKISLRILFFSADEHWPYLG